MWNLSAAHVTQHIRFVIVVRIQEISSTTIERKNSSIFHSTIVLVEKIIKQGERRTEAKVNA